MPVLRWLYRSHLLLLASPSTSCSIYFSGSLERSWYLSLFYSMVCPDDKVHDSAVSLSAFFFFWLTNTRSGHLAEIVWSLCIWKSQRNVCVSFPFLSLEMSIQCFFSSFLFSSFSFVLFILVFSALFLFVVTSLPHHLLCCVRVILLTH